MLVVEAACIRRQRSHQRASVRMTGRGRQAWRGRRTGRGRRGVRRLRVLVRGRRRRVGRTVVLLLLPVMGIRVGRRRRLRVGSLCVHGRSIRGRWGRIAARFGGRWIPRRHEPVAAGLCRSWGVCAALLDVGRRGVVLVSRWRGPSAIGRCIVCSMVAFGGPTVLRMGIVPSR